MNSSIIVIRTPDATTSKTITYPTQGRFTDSLFTIMLAHKSAFSTFTIIPAVDGGEIVDVVVYREQMYWVAESHSHGDMIEHVRDMTYGGAIKSLLFRTYFNSNVA